jgi:Cu(I)/Ag(I) efflux system periplasmic protein CusF
MTMNIRNPLSTLRLAGATLGMVFMLATQAQAADLADAEVRKIDAPQAKVTLKHGEIKNLDMPPMTMVFKVKDAALLKDLKVGDKIKFAAEKIEGQYTVTRVEPAGK